MNPDIEASSLNLGLARKRISWESELILLKSTVGMEVVKIEQESSIIKEQIEVLESLLDKVQAAQELSEKIQIVKSAPASLKFLQATPHFSHILKGLDQEACFAVTSLLAIGQGPIVFQDYNPCQDASESFQKILKILLDLEKFYDTVGGIIGYHLTVLKLIEGECLDHNLINSQSVTYYEPARIDITEDDLTTRQAVRWGIEHIRELAEIYPLGGAGDRLQLRDEKTGELLPAAQLMFGGRTLLEGLIRDLQGREYLYYKLFGRQYTVPLAIMTSNEKDNHARILQLCESNHWFGRPKKTFYFFMQPLVPMITIEGNWAMQAPMAPILKPGGHGVMWKVMEEQGIIDILLRAGCKKAIVRQINNPLAGIDNGLFALSGFGIKQNKDFGFASCPRLLNAPEGMDVLCEKKKSDGYEYCITNIEYTEFKKFGISDQAVQPGNPYSLFPSNTNILFADLKAIKSAIDQYPIPGLLINMKTTVPCYTPKGIVESKAGRLESTMQNIADYIVDHFPNKIEKGVYDQLRTFLTFNKRIKTISVTKEAFKEGKSFIGTPEGCFYDLMENYRDLLANYCHMDLPPTRSEKEYLANGPSFITLFHPALGVLFPLIGQKIRGGSIVEGSEWIMEIAEADIENLHLDGSLIIEADHIMGRKDPHGVILYDSAHTGKCSLINVSVKNKGLESSQREPAWKRKTTRSEALHITLHGNAEFFAENVSLEGEMQFDVPNGHRLVIYPQGNEIAWHYEKIQKSSWEWIYNFDENERIYLDKIFYNP
jgi:UTP---glucose-1-phosphate uridylyltransferase